MPLSALARLPRVVDGSEQPIGRAAAEALRMALIEQKMLDADGRIQPGFDPKRKDFKLELPELCRDLTPAVIDLLSAYRIERHIRKDRDEGVNRLKKEVALSLEFQALWGRIKPKTTYRVEFETDGLVQRAVDALKRMERIETPHIRVRAGLLGVEKGGVTAAAVSVAEEQVEYENRPIPDLLAYLQNETELTRSTLVRILKVSGRLEEFFTNPQRFMDAVAAILKHELHRLLVDGIKYEKIDGSGGDSGVGNAAFQERGADQLPDRSAGEQVGLRVCGVRIGSGTGVRQTPGRAGRHQAIHEAARLVRDRHARRHGQPRPGHSQR